MSYPVEDRAHAAKALQLSPRGLAAGNITPSEKAKIDAKARAVLAGGTNKLKKPY